VFVLDAATDQPLLILEIYDCCLMHVTVACWYTPKW